MLYFCFELPPFSVTRAGGGGCGFLVFITTGREGERADIYIFCASVIRLSRSGGWFFRASLSSAAALFVWMPIGREGERADLFIFI